MKKPFRPFASLFGGPLAGLLGLSLLLSACIIGGGGTDTENVSEESVDGPASERPAAGAYLRFYRLADTVAGGTPFLKAEAEVRALPGRTGSAAPGAGTGGEVRTDARGMAEFRLPEAGRFLVEGRLDPRNGAAASRGAVGVASAALGTPSRPVILFFDTVEVLAADKPLRRRFGVEDTLRYQGRVRLASGLLVDSGLIFVAGSSVHAALGPDGSYDLGVLPRLLPRGMGALGLRYRARPREWRQVQNVRTAAADSLIKNSSSLSRQDSAKLASPPAFQLPSANPLPAAPPAPQWRCDSLPPGGGSGGPAAGDSEGGAGAPADSGGGISFPDPSPKADSLGLSRAPQVCSDLRAGTVVVVRSQPLLETSAAKEPPVTAVYLVSDASAAGADSAGGPKSDGLSGAEVLSRLVPGSCAEGSLEGTVTLELRQAAAGESLRVPDLGSEAPCRPSGSR